MQFFPGFIHQTHFSGGLVGGQGENHVQRRRAFRVHSGEVQCFGRHNGFLTEEAAYAVHHAGYGSGHRTLDVTQCASGIFRDEHHAHHCQCQHQNDGNQCNQAAMTLALRFFLHNRGRDFRTLHLGTSCLGFAHLLPSGVIGVHRRTAVVPRCIHRAAYPFLPLCLRALGAGPIQTGRPRYPPRSFPVCRTCHRPGRDSGRPCLRLRLILHSRCFRGNRGNCLRILRLCLLYFRFFCRLFIPGRTAAMGTDRSLPTYRLHDPGRLLIQITSLLHSLFIITKIAQSSLLLCDIFLVRPIHYTRFDCHKQAFP